jgi:hypothetical protein
MKCKARLVVPATGLISAHGQILNQDKEMSAFQILIRDAGQASFSQGAAEPVLQQLDARSLSELPI